MGYFAAGGRSAALVVLVGMAGPGTAARGATEVLLSPIPRVMAGGTPYIIQARAEGTRREAVPAWSLLVDGRPVDAAAEGSLIVGGGGEAVFCPEKELEGKVVILRASLGHRQVDHAVLIAHLLDTLPLSDACLAEQARQALVTYDPLAERLDRAADLALWSAQAGAEHVLEKAPPRRGENRAVLLAKFRAEMLEKSRSPKGLVPGTDVHFLWRSALDRRAANPLESQPRPSDETVRLAWVQIAALLPDRLEGMHVLAHFQNLALFIEERGEAAWAGHGAGRPGGKAPFLFKHLEAEGRRLFPGRADCLDLLLHAHLGLTRRRANRPSLAVSLDENKRQSFERILDRGEILATFRDEMAERLKRSEEAAKARLDSAYEDAGQFLRRSAVELAVEGERQASLARKLLAAKERRIEGALERAALEAAESAPRSEVERQREAELERQDREEKASRRSLAKAAGSPGERPEAKGTMQDGKEEAPRRFAVRWLPEARRELPGIGLDPRLEAFVRDKLGTRGPRLAMPHARHLADGDGIRELRPPTGGGRPLRPLYAWVGGEFVILACAPDFEVNPAGFRAALERALERRRFLLGK